MPGLPERAAAEGLTPLEYMRRYGAFEIAQAAWARVHEEPVPAAELDGRAASTPLGRVYTRAPQARRRRTSSRCRRPTPTPRAAGRSASLVDGEVRRGFPTPSGRLEFYSRTLADWGWPEYALPDLHPEPRPPGPPRAGRDAADLDVPAAGADPHAQRQRQVARRDRAHQPALDPPDATRARLRRRAPATSCASRREIGHFVVKAWVTEGIRPGVVACSHHMGRWKLGEQPGSAR